MELNRFTIGGFWVLFALLVAVSCQPPVEPLPFIGRVQVLNGDTVQHKIPEFIFVNQDSQSVSNSTFAGKVYIADFFFTSCPSICPKVKKQMLRIYDAFANEPQFKMVSHTIDPKRDSIATLKIYAENLEVKSDRWHFVTGEQAKIYELADQYFVSVLEDPGAPGGFDHSGRIILIDGEGHVRSYCEGTDPEDVDRFMKDIEWLLEHQSQ